MVKVRAKSKSSSKEEVKDGKRPPTGISKNKK